MSSIGSLALLSEENRCAHYCSLSVCLNLATQAFFQSRAAPQRKSANCQKLRLHKNIPTTVRYTHVGYEQTRQTAEALSQVLE